MTVKIMIDTKFGGVKALATLLGHKHNTTVYYWCKRNFIPKWRLAQIIQVAKSKDIDVSDIESEGK